MLHRRREDPASLRHQIDLARRLELNHPRSPFSARVVMSFTAPTAFTITTLSPFVRYQPSTGAVSSSYTRSRVRIASGSSSLRRTSVPPHLSQTPPTLRPVYGV